MKEQTSVPTLTPPQFGRGDGCLETNSKAIVNSRNEVPVFDHPLLTTPSTIRNEIEGARPFSNIVRYRISLIVPAVVTSDATYPLGHARWIDRPACGEHFESCPAKLIATPRPNRWRSDY